MSENMKIESDTYALPEAWRDQLEQVLCDLKLGPYPAISLACSRIETLLAASPADNQGN